MIQATLSNYLKSFSRLRTDRTGGWTAATQGQAPHKPILLLSVLDLFAQGRITANLIEITPELGELFAAYWSKVMPPNGVATWRCRSFTCAPAVSGICCRSLARKLRSRLPARWIRSASWAS